MPAARKRKTPRRRTNRPPDPLTRREVEQAVGVILQTAALWARRRGGSTDALPPDVAADQRFLRELCDSAHQHLVSMPLAIAESVGTDKRKGATAEDPERTRRVKRHLLTRPRLRTLALEPGIRELFEELRSIDEVQGKRSPPLMDDAPLVGVLMARCSDLRIRVSGEKAAGIINDLRTHGALRPKRKITADKAVPLILTRLNLDGVGTLPHLRDSEQAARRALQKRRQVWMPELLELVLRSFGLNASNTFALAKLVGKATFNKSLTVMPPDTSNASED
jgi:hypothetical protein